MADRNAWRDHDGGGEGHWRHPHLRWELDAHNTTDTICVLMAYFLILGNLLLRMELGWKVLPRRRTISWRRPHVFGD